MPNPNLVTSTNISEEIRDLTVNEIGQILRTLGRNWGLWQTYGTVDRHMGQLADIWDIWQTYGTFGRYCEHWADIGEIGDIRQKLGRHCPDIGETLKFSIFLCKIRLFGFLIQRSRSKSEKIRKWNPRKLILFSPASDRGHSPTTPKTTCR